MRKDLKAHLLAGFIIGVWVAPWTPIGAAALVVLAAAGREAWNKWGPKDARTGWGWTDIGYTLAGGSLGVLAGVATQI